MDVYYKTPAEVITAIFDYSYYGEITGDPNQGIAGQTVTAATVAQTPVDAALVIGDASFPGLAQQAWVQVSGGTPGTSYILNCLATFSGGNQRVCPAQINCVPFVKE